MPLIPVLVAAEAGESLSSGSGEFQESQGYAGGLSSAEGLHPSLLEAQEPPQIGHW